MITRNKPKAALKPSIDATNPAHYRAHPSGVECITITEHLGFCLGNAIKYIWRSGERERDRSLEDLKKARWYIDREIARLERPIPYRLAEGADTASAAFDASLGDALRRPQ